MKHENRIFPSPADAFDACVAHIAARKIDPDVRHVVIVPDKHTLFAERRLFESGGAFDVEVVTFSRLLKKCGYRPKGYLSRFGAVMLLRKIIGDGKDLKCFHRSAKFSGFADVLYDTLSQLAASGVTPSMPAFDAELDVALKYKTQDLRTLYERYTNEISGRFADSSELLRLLPAAVKESGYLDGAHVYILNFDRLTVAHRQAIDGIAACAECVAIYASEEKKDTKLKRHIEKRIFAAPDFESELKTAAEQIRYDIDVNGYRYGDVCVVCSSPDYNTVHRIFTDYGIPFGLDKKYPLSFHPSVRFVMCALAAAEGGRLSRDAMIRFAKNSLTGITAAEAANFENYCNRRRVDYKGFLSEFDDARAEQVRTKLLKILSPLKKLDTTASAVDFANAVKETLSFAEGLENMASLSAEYDLVSFAAKFDEVISLIAEVMGDGEYPLRLLTDTLKEGTDSREISLLPAESDCVEIGQPALFRGRRFKRVFVVGFNEGALPLLTQDCGMITDSEIEKLKKCGITIEPKTEEVNDRARSELLHVIDSADRVFMSYTATDGGAVPSTLLSLIKRDNGIGVTSASVLKRAAADKDTPKIFERFACCESAACEMFADGWFSHDKPFYLPTLVAALKDKINPIIGENEDVYRICDSDKLFFRSGSAYISQLQTFFSCPYRHFLEYGLRLKEREDGSVSVKDVGILLHKVAEVFVQRGDFSEPEYIAERLFDELLGGEMKEYATMPERSLSRLKGESRRLCRSIAASLTCSRYKSVGQEIMFSSKDGAAIKADEIDIGSRKLGVVGVIDRVDKCENKVRVIDYKSGNTEGMLAAEKLYYGTKFQLQFYCEILRERGYDIGGMFYFPISGDWSEEDAYCRMKGAFDKDAENIIDMDTSLKDGGKSLLFNVNLTKKADGDFSVGRNSLAYTAAELHAMCDYSKKIFVSGARDIEDGYIKPAPASSGKSLACDYCPYTSVCLGMPVSARRLGTDKTEAVSGRKKKEGRQ